MVSSIAKASPSPRISMAFEMRKVFGFLFCGAITLNKLDLIERQNLSSPLSSLSRLSDALREVCETLVRINKARKP